MNEGAGEGGRLRVVAPPPLIYLLPLVAGLAADRLWPLATFAVPGGVAVGIAVAIAGLALQVWCLLHFRAARTTVNPYGSASTIIVDGPFRFSRNPIYVGLTLIYLGAAVAAGGWWTLGLLLPCLLVMHHGVIRREEHYLEGKFGEPYRAYMARVRRWL